MKAHEDMSYEPSPEDVSWLYDYATKRAHSDPPAFVSAKDFLAIEFPDPEPLLGERGSRFLARGSLFIVYGDGGTGKSTWTIDGVAHLAAGRSWMDIPVQRPVSFLLIENEGHPGFLQEAVRQKAKTCPWGQEWLTNVTFYSSPWGQFSYAKEAHRTALREHCVEHETDVVVSNPLLGVGASGSGRPEETALFVEWLKECGLWTELAFWLIHHENKAGQVSGDWNRHADTMAQLERNGQEESFKLTWTKPPRMGGLGEQPRIAILEWLTETRGYTLHALDQTKVSDETLRERVTNYLAEHPGARKTAVIEQVEGNEMRIRELLNEGIENGTYRVEKGPRNTLFCHLASQSISDPQEHFSVLDEYGSTERVIRTYPSKADMAAASDVSPYPLNLSPEGGGDTRHTLMDMPSSEPSEDDFPDFGDVA